MDPAAESRINLDDEDDDIEGDASLLDSDGNGIDASSDIYATKDPSESDVLCGRGGSINSHAGNERFRLLVEKRKRIYLTARFKREKRLIANSIVSEIQALKPPGRFLSRDAKSGLWVDIGEEKARDKTSQALRENAPSIRAEIETEINEQRAEMQKEEEQHAAVLAPAPGVPVHPYYNAHGWFYNPYYAYGHPPPPLPHGHLHPPPPPPHLLPPHPYHHPGAAIPPPPPSHYDPYYHGYGTVPDSLTTTKPVTPKSTIEHTAGKVVSSVAESLKSRTKNGTIFGMGGGGGGGSTSTSNEGSGSKSVASKPISYKHDDGMKKRRMVKFRDDDSSLNTINRVVRRVRPCYSQLDASDSLVDQLEDEQDMEPEKIDTLDQDLSIMGQVAQYILPTFGSWDVANIICGYDTRDSVPFPRSSGTKHNSSDEVYNDEDEAIDWEGQEVQLVDESRSAERENGVEKQQRHPVEPRHDNASSVAFSSLGSCHSWLPEQFGSAASYFNYGKAAGDEASGGGLGSMDMDYSTGGTGEYSIGGSLGGNSLSRVFENEPLAQGAAGHPATPNMNHRVLSQVPSWERSLRSKSPLSLGSHDDESLISKSSSKFEDEPTSPVNFLDGESAAIKRIEEEDMNWTQE